jgi:hypothetical protein
LTAQAKTAALLLAGTCLLGAVMFLLLRTIRPYALIPPDVAILYVGDCPASKWTYRQWAKASEEVKQHLIAVPIENNELTAQACPVALARIRRESLLLRLLPTGEACKRLVADAQRFHREHMLGLPAFSVGGVSIPRGYERLVLRLVRIAFPGRGQTFEPL